MKNTSFTSRPRTSPSCTSKPFADSLTLQVLQFAPEVRKEVPPEEVYLREVELAAQKAARKAEAEANRLRKIEVLKKEEEKKEAVSRTSRIQELEGRIASLRKEIETAWEGADDSSLQKIERLEKSLNLKEEALLALMAA